jgi:hypothetical protein
MFKVVSFDDDLRNVEGFTKDTFDVRSILETTNTHIAPDN